METTVTTNVHLEIVDVDFVSEFKRTLSILLVERVGLVDFRIVW